MVGNALRFGTMFTPKAGKLIENGAGEGNRTPTWGLESLNSAVKLRPHLD